MTKLNWDEQDLQREEDFLRQEAILDAMKPQDDDQASKALARFVLTYNQRHHQTGRFVKSEKCDLCALPMGLQEHITDEEVCGGGDGPGFYLCAREKCRKIQLSLPSDPVLRGGIYAKVRKTGMAFKP